MALSQKAREILAVAMANAKSAKEVADAVDNLTDSAAITAIAALQDAVTTLQSDLTDAQTAATALAGRVTTLETKAADFETRISALENP